MEYRLRKAVAEDFDGINTLFIEMLRFIYKKDDARGYERDALEYYFSGGEDWICVAESGGNIVGFLAIEAHREDESYIYYDDFCVTESCRGKGIGSALMAEAERYGRQIGIYAAVLHVEKTNVSAQYFYEKRGFGVLRDDGERLCLIKQITE